LNKKQEFLLTDRLKDLFDIEIAFARIEALSNLLIEYVHNSNETNEIAKQETISFNLMTIRDYAKFYGNQVQNLQIIDGELRPIKRSCKNEIKR
jgi:hypothetical protein